MAKAGKGAMPNAIALAAPKAAKAARPIASNQSKALSCHSRRGSAQTASAPTRQISNVTL